MSRALDEATVSIERRIAEIDRLLSETEVLRAEREHLTRALEEVAAAAKATRATGPRRSSATRTRTRSRSSTRRERAPEGLNRERIIGFLRDSGPAAASAIAKGTGINRAVVYNNLSKLTAEGTAASVDRGDGTRRFALTR